MNVSLGMQWEQFVNEKVESGRYQTASEVLRDGLRLIEQRDKALRRMSPQTMEELEEMLALQNLGPYAVNCCFRSSVSRSGRFNKPALRFRNGLLAV